MLFFPSKKQLGNRLMWAWISSVKENNSVIQWDTRSLWSKTSRGFDSFHLFFSCLQLWRKDYFHAEHYFTQWSPTHFPERPWETVWPQSERFHSNGAFFLKKSLELQTTNRPVIFPFTSCHPALRMRALTVLCSLEEAGAGTGKRPRGSHRWSLLEALQLLQPHSAQISQISHSY